METKGKKRVEIAGLHENDRSQQFFAITIDLWWENTTPVYDFPDNWCVTHSENHWSNEETMIEYIQGIIVPYVEGVRQMLGKNDQAVLAIFDNFRGQLTENVVEELKRHNI